MKRFINSPAESSGLREVFVLARVGYENFELAVPRRARVSHPGSRSSG